MERIVIEVDDKLAKAWRRASEKKRKTIHLTISCLLLSLSAFSQIEMQKSDDGVLFTDGTKKVAFYQKEAPESNRNKGHSNYFHPVYLPDGTVVTEDAPEDHIHHRGIYWAWHQILMNGKQLGDQWVLENFTHDVKDVDFSGLADGSGVFKTMVEWKSPAYKNGEKAFLEERTTVNFHPQKKNYRIIQFEIQLKALVENLQLGGSDDVKGYGGFSVRMKLPGDVNFSSARTPVEPTNEAIEAENHINITGSLARDSGLGGVLIYSTNDFETANKWILRKQKSMQNAVWPGREPVAISTTEPTTLKYVVVLYTGRINESRLAKELSQLKWD